MKQDPSERKIRAGGNIVSTIETNIIYYIINRSLELRKKYASQMLQTEQLFNEDQRTRMLSRSYYLLALRQLADEGKIEVQYTDGKNHKASVLISPSCYIKFI